MAVIELEVPLPRAGLEIRTEGLWATHICETPFDHWTVGLEAFGLGVDDPAELYGRQYGERVPLGFDLEWEASAPAHPEGDSSMAFAQACRVSGEILVGSVQIDFDGHGHRSRQWGPRRDWDSRWFRVRGRLDDGSTFTTCVVDGDIAGASGSVDGATVDVVAVIEAPIGAGLPQAARVVMAGLEVGIDPIAATPLEVVDAEGRVRRGHPERCAGCRPPTGGSGWPGPSGTCLADAPRSTRPVRLARHADLDRRVRIGQCRRP